MDTHTHENENETPAAAPSGPLFPTSPADITVRTPSGQLIRVKHVVSVSWAKGPACLRISMDTGETVSEGWGLLEDAREWLAILESCMRGEVLP